MVNVRGANLEHARRLNRRAVLDAVRLRAPSSRAEIARLTGLSPQTIANITDELCAAGLLIAKSYRTGGRGQPALGFEINAEGGFTFGISLDHSGLVILLTDVAGGIRDREQLPLKSLPPEIVIGMIASAVEAMLARSGVDRRRVWGAGVVVPARQSDGQVVAYGPCTLPSWKQFPLKSELGTALGMPVFVENDAVAAAVAERLHGIGKAHADFVYLYFGAGIGGGLMLGGRPYRGGSAKAGQLGHVVVQTGGRPCHCGQCGCLERYASLSAAQALLTGLPEGEQPLDIALINDAFMLGDAQLLGWMDEAADKLSTAVRIIDYIFDPEGVVLGGIIPRPLLEGLHGRLVQRLAGGRPVEDRAPPTVLVSEIGRDTPALGASALPIFDGITPELSLVFEAGSVEAI
ncbi:ROK family transcriptional regulator [Arenibaculum pallidiluteum]|uniref:ROK family transcriptional regulator n=1 Tax=Arenibaculum pallidiluteum TaxID=2812559 RepID=UPI001A9569A0|nr:ROK family transcriptional regulator [Arenibaculum pallidiluteum]